MRPILARACGRRRRRRRCRAVIGDARPRSARAGTPSRRGVRGAGRRRRRWRQLRRPRQDALGQVRMGAHPLALGRRPAARACPRSRSRRRARRVVDEGGPLDQGHAPRPGSPSRCAAPRREPSDTARVPGPRRRLQVGVVGERGQSTRVSSGPSSERSAAVAARDASLPGVHVVEVAEDVVGVPGDEVDQLGSNSVPRRDRSMPTAASTPPNRDEAPPRRRRSARPASPGRCRRPRNRPGTPLPSHRSNACDSADPDGVAEARAGRRVARPSGSG